MALLRRISDRVPDTHKWLTQPLQVTLRASGESPAVNPALGFLPGAPFTPQPVLVTGFILAALLAGKLALAPVEAVRNGHSHG